MSYDAWVLRSEKWRHLLPERPGPLFRGPLGALSNLFPCRLEWRGEVYGSVEAAFQASKCADAEARAQFAGLSGAAAKALGRRVVLRADWEARKLGFMRFWLRLKFRNPTLAAILLSTGDMEIVEWNTWGDRYWGKTLDGRGQNHLGILLMEVRGELRAGGPLG